MVRNIIGYTFCLLSVFLCFSVIADTFVVTNTADSGAGSFRQAITEANENAGADTITFNIPLTDDGFDGDVGIWTIQPAEGLPILTDPGTFIYGGSQTSNMGDTNTHGPEIEIDGTMISGYGIGCVTSHTIIQGLIINRFPAAGIRFAGADSNTVRGTYIGVDATGMIASPNYAGIELVEESQQNLIGGNRDEDRNVLSGNSAYGIYLSGSGTDGNKIRGNYIGTNAAGDDTLGNSNSAIRIAGGPSGNRIGGVVPEQRNIIAGTSCIGNIYSGNGITITNSNGNLILGNYIGTDKTGTMALPNIDYGIMIKECESTVVGGTAAGRGNVISGNGQAGIFIRSNTSTNTSIAGNFIGTDSSGELPVGNRFYGIVLDYGAHDNLIGPDNTIAHNDRYGVRSEHDSTRANTITMNSIYNHSYSGIRNNGGSNDSIQAPVLTNVTESEISGLACPGCVIEIFSDEEDEGAFYEGSTTADDGGEFFWTGILTGPVITATATDSVGNTSEFSEPYSLAIEDFEHDTNPRQFVLSNYPNPFSTSTWFSYFIPNDGNVQLVVMDLNGRELVTIVEGHHQRGSHTISWNGKLRNGKKAPNGVYMYTLDCNGRTVTRRMVFLGR